ncbi:hypothetical protein DFQ12_0815 [Sphingobacterium detergens]|uniref:Uncharacterized protein n=1 Tax=Sphingobacterium detergens TaxID=1145106 RepID=A0A420BGZ2_SPHD1|nr:hypothetical protein DFQ12_0815 [Sphingobacterium detergens]
MNMFQHAENLTTKNEGEFILCLISKIDNCIIAK